MNKKLLLSYIVVIFLMFAYAGGAIGLSDSSDHILFTFSGDLTFQFPSLRMLVPIIANALVLFMPPDVVLATILFVSGVIAFWSLRSLMSKFMNNELYYFFTFIILYLIFLYNRSPLDFVTVFLFCLAFRFLLEQKTELFITVFIFATLHRETSILLVVFYSLYTGITNIKGSVGLFCIYIAIRAELMYLAGNYQANLSYLFVYDVMGVYLTSWFTLILVAVLGLIAWKLYRNWNSIPIYLRAGVAVFSIQLVLHLLVGYPFEVRVMAESVPLVMIALQKINPA